MNIHEHQAKKILKEYGAIVPNGVFAFSVDELVEKAKSLQTKKFTWLTMGWCRFSTLKEISQLIMK